MKSRSHAADKFPEPEKLQPQPGLPEALVLNNGKKVTNRKEWVNKRRPELLQLFQHYMYGTMPPAPKKVQARVERVEKDFFGGKATKKEITITYGPTNLPPIHLLFVVQQAQWAGPGVCGTELLRKSYAGLEQQHRDACRMDAEKLSRLLQQCGYGNWPRSADGCVGSGANRSIAATEWPIL